MPTYLHALLIIAAAGMYASSSHADTVTEGHALAKAADSQLRGYADSQVSLTMELVSPNGQTASRALRVQSLETDSGEYTLMIFDTPRDVAGSALLLHNFRAADDQQWLYLPSIRRVKQIGARDKSGPFMGSEFAFEDLVTPFYEKFSYRYEEDEACGELTCAIVERIPRDPHTGYTRQRVWIDREYHLIRQVTYYDRRDTLLKTYTASDFEQYENRHWRPAAMRMQNHQNRRQTFLLWQDFQFGLGLEARDFTQNALLRAR